MKSNDPEPHDDTAGTFWTWVIGITVFIIFFWVTSSWLPDDQPSGRCQQELGYMGQVEYYDCEEYP